MDKSKKSESEGSLKEDMQAIQRYPINFSIFSLARAHRGLAAHLLRDAGLYVGQELMLMQLWEKDEQSQQSLGFTMRLDHSTVAKSVRRMENAGLVTRSRSPKDARVMLVKLTEVGRNLVAKSIDVWTEMEEIASTGLTEQEKELLISLSQKISANIESKM